MTIPPYYPGFRFAHPGYMLEAAGFIRMKAVGRRKAPSAAIKKIVVEIDPFSQRDRLRVA